MNKADLILRTRTLASGVLSVLSQYDALKTEYDALDAGNVLVDADFEGSDVTKAQYLDAMTSLQHVADARLLGHATNLYRVKL